jgi:hypothetical protein
VRGPRELFTTTTMNNIIPFTGDELSKLENQHIKERAECVEDLLRGMPEDGGSASRESFQSLIECAFTSGAQAQLLNPYQP